MSSFFRKRPAGMQAFYTIWIGQLVSLFGSAMTRFALTLWAWELTGSATALAFVAFFSFLPGILFSPVAGALVDRWDRRIVMMLSDLAAGVGSIVLLFLSFNGSLALWHVYSIGLVAGTFEAFQFPAYSAAITTMVGKDQYARTSAMLSMAQSASGIFAPIVAAGLYAALGLNGILMIDISTFLLAYITLLIIKIPPVKHSAEGVESRASFVTELGYGFRFIWRRRSPFWLQTAFFFANLLFGMVSVLLAPLILARTGNNEAILGIVSATASVGGLVGGILMSMHGGLKERRVRMVVFGFVIYGLLSAVVVGIGQQLLLWMIGAFVGGAIVSPINASNQAIWQSKVPPDVQGKVFAARRVIASISTPITMIAGGLLADYVFEPAMQADGLLAPVFGPIVGTGSGAGMGLMFVFIGIGAAVIGLMSYGVPIIRDVEDIVPDFEPDLITTPD